MPPAMEENSNNARSAGRKPSPALAFPVFVGLWEPSALPQGIPHARFARLCVPALFPFLYKKAAVPQDANKIRYAHYYFGRMPPGTSS